MASGKGRGEWRKEEGLAGGGNWRQNKKKRKKMTVVTRKENDG